MALTLAVARGKGLRSRLVAVALVPALARGMALELGQAPEQALEEVTVQGQALARGLAPEAERALPLVEELVEAPALALAVVQVPEARTLRSRSKNRWPRSRYRHSSVRRVTSSSRCRTAVLPASRLAWSGRR